MHKTLLVLAASVALATPAAAQNARYVNHSCRPNADAKLRKRRLIYVALRDIAPEEEITLDYGEEYFDLFIRDAGCRCAACRAKGDVRR